MRNTELGGDGIPFVRGGDIGDGWINTEVEDHIRPELAESVANKLAVPGDVAFIVKGSVGRVGRLRKGQPQVVFAPQVSYWRVLNPEVLDPRFVFYLIKSSEFQSALDGVKTHGSMVADYVSISQQYDFRLRIPPLGDQQAIAATLGALDDKIDLNRRIAATACELAHAIFRARYSSDDPSLPHEPLGEHLDVVRGLSYTGSGLADDGVPLHNLNSVRAGGGYWREGIKFYEGEHEERHFVQPGDVVVASVDLTWNFEVIASPARIPRRYGRSLFSQDLFVVRPKAGSPLTSAFVYLMLLPGRLRSEVAGYGNGTTVNRIPVEALQKPRFAIPLREVVEEVDALVTPLFDRAEAAEDESETLAELRDTLLPKLISGEVRLKDVPAA